MVRLRGTAGSFREKREADRDAKRVHGVELVDNKLQVRPLSNREDVDLGGDVLQALPGKVVGTMAEVLLAVATVVTVWWMISLLLSNRRRRR